MSESENSYSIGRYQVTRKLGRGGMGIVYLAYDPFIDRMVAIKEALTAQFEDANKLEDYRTSFLNEARAAGKLVHPHIVSVYDAAVENSRCYLVMEYVDGPTLKKYCTKDNLLPLEDAVAIIYQCATALAYAHENGVIHRDIKPANIMLSNRKEAKITDFGIAVMGDPVTPSTSEEPSGSAPYTAPEQLQNGPITPGADLFSLGVVMYELLAGTNPFNAGTSVASVYRIINEDPPSLKETRPDLPDEMADIVQQALKKDLKERYQSAEDVIADLTGAFEHLRLSRTGNNLQRRFNALKKIEFFRNFNAIEINKILQNTQWLQYGASSTIIIEGDREDSFYILISGEVVVRKMGKAIAVLKKGDCFGEMACLGGERRSASIEALTESILMKIDTSVIEQTPEATQLRFYKVFSSTLIKRLAQTSRLLSQAAP